MLEQSVPEGLHSMGRTDTGAVHEDLVLFLTILLQFDW